MQQVVEFQRLDQIGVEDHGAVGNLDVLALLPGLGDQANAFFQNFAGAEHRAVILHGALHFAADFGGTGAAIGIAHRIEA